MQAGTDDVVVDGCGRGGAGADGGGDGAVVCRVAAGRGDVEPSAASERLRRGDDEEVVRRPCVGERPSRARLTTRHGRSSSAVTLLLQVHAARPSAVHATNGRHMDDGGIHAAVGLRHQSTGAETIQLMDSYALTHIYRVVQKVAHFWYLSFLPY